MAAITKLIKPSTIEYLNSHIIQSPYPPWGRYYLMAEKWRLREAKGSICSGSLGVSSEARIESRSTGLHGPYCVLLS